MIPYRIVRSRRKTVAICVDHDGNVEVRAPLRVREKAIENFVAEKQGWIAEKSYQLREKAQQRALFQIVPGSQVQLLGRQYPVRRGKAVAFDGKEFTVPSGSFSEIKPQLVEFYKNMARDVIPERILLYAPQIGLAPTSVKIGSSNTAWGTCTGKNGLIFTWKLMMAPLEVVDYVVVHELAHMREHNHSVRFWKLVEQICPDYRSCKEQLKLLQKKLDVENWQ